MERSIFGFFTAFLCVICILTGAQAFRKKRYGLSALLWLNAFTNLVNSVHAFLYDLILDRMEGNHAYK